VQPRDDERGEGRRYQGGSDEAASESAHGHRVGPSWR
jgi:hypothetical protein